MDEVINKEEKTSHRRSTENYKHRRKSRMPSSSSLRSLSSILKPSTHSDQYCVSFVDELKRENDSKTSISDEKITNFFSESSSQFHSAIENNADAESFKPMNVVAEGSVSTQQSSTTGLRASFFYVLEKLGVIRSEEKTTAASEIKAPSERRLTRNSVASLYYRTFHGGKFIEFFFI